jgi:hypothetical protein
MLLIVSEHNLMNADGSTAQQLTQTSREDYFPIG